MKKFFLNQPRNLKTTRSVIISMRITLLLVLLISFGVSAQNRTVTGVVLDENNMPLPGASIIVTNTTTGTVSDFDGNYSIKIPSSGGTALTFSYVGYIKQSITIGSNAVINVTLEPDLATLDEIVVVGYGTQKKESLSASVAVIDSEEIQTTTNVSVAQKLTGKIAGVQIRQQSGQPGSFDNDINIRGFGAPIYVIDGIRRGGSSDFQQLNADDIETISILKDAAAAIYGLGAANGVVLVTTKKGSKSSKPSFNYSSVFSIVKPTDIPKMANAAQYTEMWNDTQLFIPGGEGTPFYSPEELELWRTGAPGYEGTDWEDLTIKKSTYTQQHNFSATGGTDKTNYFISFGFVDEEGLIKSNDIGYKRYNIRSNLTTEFAKNLTGSLLISGRWDSSTQPGANFFNIFKGTRVTLPTESAYANDNQDYLAPVSSGLNPVAFMERDITGYSDNTTRTFNSTFSLEYKAPFLEGLALKGVVSYDANNFQNKALVKPYNLYTYDETTEEYLAQKQNDGTANISNRNRNSDAVTLQGYVTYNRNFNETHNIGFTGVIEKNTWEQRESFLRRYYRSFYTKDQIRFADVLSPDTDGIENESADFSYIGRFNYDFRGKYFVEVAGRYMGSYRYAPENRYGFFPTASAAWRVSEEPFIKNNVSWLSNLKFRGSYGIIGMPEGDPFQYVEGFSIGSGGSYEFVDGELTEGIATPPIANANLTWMEAKTTNLAVDIGLFQNRFTFTAEVYERLLEGMPAKRSIALPNTYGGELPQENLNSELTQGLDLSISYRDMIGKDFSYRVSANFNHARTKRKYVEGEAFTSSYGQWRNQQSNRWNDIAWGYNYIGQFASEEELRLAPLQNGDRSNSLRELPGDFKYEDWNEDGVINGLDEQPLFYSGKPKMFYGFTLDLEYKGWYANLLLQGAANYTVRFREVYAEMFAFRGNTPAYFYDRWKKEDPYDINSAWIPGEWPASRAIADVGRMYAESSVWRRDASYLRLKSLEIGYNLKLESLQKALGINNLRIYGSGFNLYTWADEFVKPFDPEKIEGSFSAGFTYPVTSTFNFGVNVNF